MIRNLDGSFFRVKRDGKWQNICFSDLTSDERLQVLEGRDIEFMKRLCLIMADELKRIGDECNIVRR